MKDLKAFIEDLKSNENLAKKFENVKDSKEIVELAKKEGYEFTEDEFMDLQLSAVSGGFSWGDAKNLFGKFVGTAATVVNEADKMINQGKQSVQNINDSRR